MMMFEICQPHFRWWKRGSEHVVAFEPLSPWFSYVEGFGCRVWFVVSSSLGRCHGRLNLVGDPGAAQPLGRKPPGACSV